MANEAASNGAPTGTEINAAWKEVRADTDIQFAAAAPEPEPELPQWWKDFQEWLSDVLAPLAEGISDAWPVLRIILLALLALGVLTLLWAILKPYIDDWRGRVVVNDDEDWQPDHAVARQLLQEADALATNGQYEEAVHLLLHRSIEDIEKRRPDLLRPSNTSREIEKFDGLPEKARAMFTVIADHVERGIFAAIPVGEEGWTSAREAYSEFALRENWQMATRQ